MMFFVVLLWVFLGSVRDGRCFLSFGDVTCRPQEECVPIKSCEFFSQLVDKSPIPTPRAVINIVIKHHCGLYDNAPKVCCMRSTTTTTTTTTTTPPPLKWSANKNIQKWEPEWEPEWLEDDLTTHRNYHLLPNDICGQSQAAPDFRITSGSKTMAGEFPWMALIAYATDDPDDSIDFRCAGTVIHERFVLTAAHCILNSSIIGVRLGEHDLRTKVDCEGDYCSPPPQDFLVEDVIVHPRYNPKTFANDIALIKLKTPANFSYENVQPICLPTTESRQLNGKNAIVCGWGVTEDGRRSPVLLKAAVPFVPQQRCRRVYRRFAPLGPLQLCAGGRGGRDSCGGDSGGPLQMMEYAGGAARFVQRGLVSFGPRVCGSEGQPGVYTDVAGYGAWVLEEIGRAAGGRR